MPVKFYLSPQANKAGEKPIRVSIMVKGAQYQIALGLPDEAVEVVPKEKKIGLFTRLKEFIAEESAANGWAYATLQCWTTSPTT